MKRDLMRDLYPDDPNGPAGAPELSDLEQRKTEELSLYGSWRRAKQNETINFNRGHVPIDEDDVRYKPLTMSLLLRLLVWLGPYKRLYIIGTIGKKRRNSRKSEPKMPNVPTKVMMSTQVGEK